MYTETFVGILAEAVVAQRFSRRADHAESVWQLGACRSRARAGRRKQPARSPVAPNSTRRSIIGAS